MRIWNDGQRRFLSFSKEEKTLIQNNIKTKSRWIDIDEYDSIQKSLFKLFPVINQELDSYYLAKAFSLNDTFEFHPLNPIRINLEIGTPLYHLTTKLDDIKKSGYLIGTDKSGDNIKYSEKRVYLAINLNELNRVGGTYLKNREKIELIYNGKYELFIDPEYDGTNNFVYVKTEKLSIF